MTQQKAKILFLSGAAASAIFVVILIFVNIVLILKLSPAQQRKAKLEAQLEEIYLKQREIENSVEYIVSGAGIQDYAREVLGYTKPGEIKFVSKK